MSKLKLQGFKMKRIGLKPTLRKPSNFFKESQSGSKVLLQIKNHTTLIITDFYA